MVGMPSLYEMLMAAAASAAMNPDQPQQWPVNPFPSGVRQGSVTDRVLIAVVEHHPKWLEHYELIRLTGGSRGAIAWAVRYLQEHGKLRSIQSARNPQYRRYQAVIEKG